MKPDSWTSAPSSPTCRSTADHETDGYCDLQTYAEGHHRAPILTGYPNLQ